MGIEEATLHIAAALITALATNAPDLPTVVVMKPSRAVSGRCAVLQWLARLTLPVRRQWKGTAGSTRTRKLAPAASPALARRSLHGARFRPDSPFLR